MRSCIREGKKQRIWYGYFGLLKKESIEYNQEIQDEKREDYYHHHHQPLYHNHCILQCNGGNHHQFFPLSKNFRIKSKSKKVSESKWKYCFVETNVLFVASYLVYYAFQLLSFQTKFQNSKRKLFLLLPCSKNMLYQVNLSVGLLF